MTCCLAIPELPQPPKKGMEITRLMVISPQTSAQVALWWAFVSVRPQVRLKSPQVRLSLFLLTSRGTRGLAAALPYT